MLMEAFGCEVSEQVLTQVLIMARQSTVTSINAANCRVMAHELLSTWSNGYITQKNVGSIIANSQQRRATWREGGSMDYIIDAETIGDFSFIGIPELDCSAV
jgi:hypothetical protein